MTIWIRVFLPFAAGYTLSYLYRTMNAVLSPHLVADLHLDAGDLGLLTSAYFLSFAICQLPLGLLLDRLGPRRVEATLLIFAAIGALLFALSTTRTELIIGRGLIGLGVSACLMASFKAFTLWFPVSYLPAINGWIMATGGLGALAATTPLEIVLTFTDWRGVFIGLAILSALIAVLLWRIVPEPAPTTEPIDNDWRAQWRGVVAIYRSPIFWRIAPSSIVSQATFLAIQGLWAGPFLRDVAGLDKTATAHVLSWVAVAMAMGFITTGQLVYQAARYGIAPLTISIVGMALFMAVQLALLCGMGPSLPLWMAFGGIGTIGTVSYALLTQSFAPQWAGRVNTALNVLVFSAAFIAQWGIGMIINHWPTTVHGYAPMGYQWAFGLMLVLQLITWAPLLFRRKL